MRRHWSSWTQNEHGWQLNRYICFKCSLQMVFVFSFYFFKRCISTELLSSAFHNQYWQLQWDACHLSSNSGTKNRMWLAITGEGTIICVESQMWCRWWKKCFSLLSLGMHIKNKKVRWLHALKVQSKLHWTGGIILRLVGNNFILVACTGT